MSLLRRLSNPFQFMSGLSTPRSDDLRTDVKDDVFRWQLGGTDFERLDADSILRADICGTHRSYAEKVIKACHKSGIIEPDTGRPDTTKIDRNIVKTMPVIRVEKQRELVMLLFFWEEEITRWRLLSGEEQEIQQTLRTEELSPGYRIELEEALKIVQAKKRVLPSLRDQNGRVTNMPDEQLPSYEEARRHTR